MLFFQQPRLHIKAPFSVRHKKKYFTKSAVLLCLLVWLHNGFTNSLFFLFLFFFLFTLVLMVDSFVLKWQETTAANLSLWYIPSNSTFPSNIVTILCFLGALLASLELLIQSPMSPMVLVKVYDTVRNMKKNKREPRSVFTVICNLLQTAYREVVSVTWPFKQILAILELTKIETGGGYEVTTVIRYVLYG